MTETLHNAPIVLDNGSGTIRAGFAGEDLPKCYFPSFVGRPKHLRVLAGALEGDVFIGKRAEELRGLLKIRYPLEHGIVTDWDDMERIWQFVYQEELKTLSEEVWFPQYLPQALTPRVAARAWLTENLRNNSTQSFSQNLHSTLERIEIPPPKSSSKLSMFRPCIPRYRPSSHSTPLAALPV